MYIVSKETGIILNFGNITELFAGSNGTAVAAKQADGKIILLKSYGTANEAKEALAIIAEGMERKNVVYVPDEETVKARIIRDNPYRNPHHYEDGRKTRGHGGS